MIWPEALTFGSLSLFAIVITVALYLVGYPILRKLPWSKAADLPERACLGLMLGMVVLVLSSALVSFAGAFLFVTFVVLLGLGVVFFVWDHRTISKANFQTGISRNAPFLVVLCIFAFLTFNAISGLVGSTDADEAAHTQFIQVILTNSRVVDRLLPLYNYLFYQPPGPHIIGAFSVFVASYPIQIVVISLSAVFTIATVAGIYVLTKALFKSTPIAVIGCVLAAFAWNFWNPLSFTFTEPIMAFSICAGILLLLRTFDSNMNVWNKAVMLSIVFSYSIFILPGLPVYLASFTAALLGVRAITWRSSRQQAALLSAGFLLSAFLTVLLSSPFLVVVAEFLRNSAHGLPSDWIAPALRSTYVPYAPISYFPLSSSVNPFRVLFLGLFYISNYAASAGALLYLGPLSILFVVMYLVIRFGAPKFYQELEPKTKARWLALTKITSIFFVQFGLLLTFIQVAYSQTFPSIFGLPSFPISYLADPARDIEMLYLPLIILTCAVLSFLAALPSFVLGPRPLRQRRRYSMMPSLKILTGNRPARVILVSAVVCLVVVGQAVGSRGIGVEDYVRSPTQIYADRAMTVRQYDLLTSDDLATFQWIEANTSRSAIFLVSQIDAGEYLTSVTGRPSVYPYGPPEASAHYRLLQFAMEIDPGNPYLVSLLKYFNISYVFVGSKVASPTAGIWASWYQEEAFFNASRLLESPFLTPVQHFGNSWVFKVDYAASINGTGPLITALHYNLMFSGNSSIGSWEVGKGTRIPSFSRDSITLGFDSQMSASFQVNGSISLNATTEIGLVINGSSAVEYRLTIYDGKGDLRYWTFNGTGSPSLILLGTSNFQGQSAQSISLANVTHIEIDTPNGVAGNRNVTVNIGPIFSIDKLSMNPLSEHFDVSTETAQWNLNLSGHGSFIVLVPPFLTPSENSLRAADVQVLPTSDLLVNVTAEKCVTLSFQASSENPQELVTSSVSRPIRTVSFESVNSWSSASLSTEYDSGPLGGTTFSTNLARTWDLVILRLNDMDVSEGRLVLAVFVNGTFVGSGGAVISIYNNYTDATNHRDALGQFHLTNTQRWLIFSVPLSNIGDLCINFENPGLVGQIYLNPLVYSNNAYY